MTVLQVNRLNIVDQLLDWKADGIITDCTSASGIAYGLCLLSVVNLRFLRAL